MKKGIKFDNYNQRLIIQKVYDDNSLGKEFYILLKDNFLKLEVDASAWKFFGDCSEVINIMKDDIVGVDLNIIKEELINCGYVEL